MNSNHRFMTTYCQIHKMLEIVCKSDIMKQAGETIKDFEFADNRYGRNKAGTFNEKGNGIKTVEQGIEKKILKLMGKGIIVF